MGIGLTLRNGFVEEFAKRFISTFWVELKTLFLWHDPSHMLVMVMKGLGELLTVVEVATGTYVHAVVQKLPVGINVDLWLSESISLGFRSDAAMVVYLQGRKELGS